MAAEINRGFRWLYNFGGGHMEVERLPVKISQTIYKGTIVNLSATSGSVRVVAEADTSLYGVALHNKTTSATQKTEYLEITPFVIGAVFEAVGAPSTMTMARRTATVGFMNLHADVEIPTASYCRIDTAAAVPTLRIVGWDQDEGGGEDVTGAGRKWHVTIDPTFSQYQTTQEA